MIMVERKRGGVGDVRDPRNTPRDSLCAFPVCFTAIFSTVKFHKMNTQRFHLKICDNSRIITTSCGEFILDVRFDKHGAEYSATL